MPEPVLVWNGIVARLPALAVRPRSVRELAAAVRLARDHGLLLRLAGVGDEAEPLAERAVTLDLSGLPRPAGSAATMPDGRRPTSPPGSRS